MMTGKFDIDSKEFDRTKCMAQAQQGNPDAQVSIAYCYILGLHDLEEDENKGFEYAQLAANQGSPNGFDCLADCYESGCGVKQDEKKAFYWYKKSAEEGFAEGMKDLGRCYANGIGTKKNEQLAFEWYQKAADQKLLQGIESLGLCYLEGIGTKKNGKKVRKLLEEAADRDSTFAMFWLARHHEDKEEWEKSFKYLKKGRELGDCDCQVRLGKYYHEGLGVTRDDHKAYDLIHKAAVKYEDGDALYWLGWCYHEGVGVAKDEDMATTYYRKAVEKGYQEPEDKAPTLEDAYEDKMKGATAKSNRQAVNYKQDKKRWKTALPSFRRTKARALALSSGQTV